MAVGKDKERIVVTVSKELLDKLDSYADEIGMTRSGLCAYLIGQGMYSIKRGSEVMELIGKEVAKAAKDMQMPGQITVDELVGGSEE